MLSIKSNRELRVAMREFFASIEKDVQPSNTVLDFDFFMSKGRWVHGTSFIESEAAETARSVAVERSLKLLGPIAGDEEEIEDLLWKSQRSERRISRH